ncbi:MAG TPA: hypothetical protein DEF89_07895, partial [Desulfosporosinus sp.]|nr:hypothetical protein [Desulfosporosinus sp.]
MTQNIVAVKKKTDFVDILQVIPNLELDIKYATTDNFTHTKLYDSPPGVSSLISTANYKN